jgi:hypothetical protein
MPSRDRQMLDAIANAALGLTLITLGCVPEQPTAPEPDACSLGSVQPSPLRRLTTAQYFNSLRDLFTTPDGQTLAVLDPPISDQLVSPETLWLPDEQTVSGYAGNAQGQVVSPVLVERYGQNAIDVAAEVGERIDEFLGCDPEGDPHGCGLAYLEDLAGRAWRRPLSEDERAALRSAFDDDRAQWSATVAVQLGIQMIIQSPYFSYLPELALSEAPEQDGAADCSMIPLSGHEMAARLSYFLWNTTPDAWLLEQAQAGDLTTRESVATVAAQMLASPRYVDGALQFHAEWLRLDRIRGYRREVLGSVQLDEFVQVPLLREQAERFLAPIITQPGRSFAEILTSTQVPMHGALAEIYGVEVPDSSLEDGIWIDVELPADQRAGALTLAGHLSAHATDSRANPVRRGVFVLDRLLCAEPPPPPLGVDTSVVDGQSNTDLPTSNRERYAAHTDNDACRDCHAAIDPFGFAFEHYNAAGVWWSQESWDGDPSVIQWLEIDASGVLDGTLIPEPLRGRSFADAVELLHILAESPEVHDCYVRHLVRYALGRGLDSGTDAVDEQLVEQLARDFYEADGALDSLVLAIVTSEPFMHRVMLGTEVSP